MGATITKKLELHNPYALKFDGSTKSQTALPAGACPVGNKLGVEFWYYGSEWGLNDSLIIDGLGFTPLQEFDEELSDFDVVTPTWDGKVDEVADFDAVTDADNDMNDAPGEGHDGGNAIEFTFDDANVAFGTINADAVDQTSGVISFWFNPNDLALEVGKYIDLVYINDGADISQWVLRIFNSGGVLATRPYYRTDGGVFISIGDWENIETDFQNMKLLLSASSGVGNNDGFLHFYINDTLIVSGTGHDNDEKDWDYMRVGIVSTNSTTFGGSFLIDTIKVDPVGGPMLDTLAAQNGTYGMSIPVMDTTARSTTFTDPTAETAVTAETRLDPNTLTMGNNEYFYFLWAGDFYASLLYSGGSYYIRVVATKDAGTESTGNYAITDAPHKIRIVWEASSGANDGYLKLYIDNVLMEILSGLDNDTKTVEEIRFGAVAGLDAGTYGIFYMDDCKWGNEPETQLDILYDSTNSKIEFYCGGNGAGVTDSFETAITQEQWEGWHHWAFMKDAVAGAMLIRLDGDLLDSVASGKTALISDPASEFNIDVAQYGKIAELRFWSDIRTASETKDNMRVQLEGNEAGLNAYYRFKDKAGTTLTDETSNSYDGTITTPDWVAGCPVAGGGWEDITTDLLPDWGYDHFQGTPMTIDLRNRVAQPGLFNFVLNNSVKNSASTAGYYSPGHGSVRDGFAHGAAVRVTYSYSGTDREIWVGRIYDIDPDPELKGSNITRCTAYDWMFEAGKQLVRGLAVQIDKRGDQALVSLLGIMPIGKMPQATSFDIGVETSSYIFDTELDERTKVSGVCRRIAMTEFGRVFVDGGTLYFKNRHASVEETVVQHDFDDADPAVRFIWTKYAEKNIFTRVKAKCHPRKIDDDKTTILAALNTAILIGSGVTKPVILRYRDPDSVSRISAKDLHDDFPEEGVDYVAKVNEDGTGSDLSSNLVVTIVIESANSIELSVYNSGSQAAWTGGTAGAFQVRGQGMYRFDPAWSESVSNQDTLNKYGDREFEYDLPYGDNPLTADGYSTYILEQTEVPRLDIGGIEFYPEAHADLAAAFIAIHIGMRVTCARTMLGLDTDFFVTRIQTQGVGKYLKVTYGVEQALSSAYCKLDDPIYAELDAEVCRAAF